MRKSIILFLLGLCLAFNANAQISLTRFLTADDTTTANLDANFVTIQGAINSADGALMQGSSITASALDNNANPEVRWDEAFNDFVFTGLTIPVSASLSSTSTAGTAYVNGTRVVKAATANTYTASRWDFVDVSDNGTFTHNIVVIGAADPAVTANSIRLARVSTDSTTVLAVNDLRVTAIALSNTSLITDADTDTTVDTETNSDEDIIRFTADGTQEAQIDTSGLTLKTGASVNEFSTDATLAGDSDDAVPTEKAMRTFLSTGAARAWVNVDVSGAPSIQDSFNVSGVTDPGGTGEWDIEWDTDFADDDYIVVFGNAANRVVGLKNGVNNQAEQTVSEITIQAHDNSAALEDTAYICAAAFGNQ